jgi:predicted TIM-barrel enzyme
MLHLTLTATLFLRLEVEMIAQAHKMGLLTTPYAFDEEQAKAMAEAGADIGEGRRPLISTSVSLSLLQTSLCPFDTLVD